MITATTSPTVHGRRPPLSTRVLRPSAVRYWLAAAIALLGLVGGTALGITSFREGQRRIDSFDRIAVPGTMSVHIDQPTGRVVYYEGSARVRFDDLSISVTGPTGAPVPVHRYAGELVYETLDLTQGRALGTFDARDAGSYQLRVSGADSGQVVVGESFSRRALPGVVSGLAIVLSSLLAAFVLWLVTFIQRSERAPDSRVREAQGWSR